MGQNNVMHQSDNACSLLTDSMQVVFVHEALRGPLVKSESQFWFAVRNKTKSNTKSTKDFLISCRMRSVSKDS
eukprot:621204-Amphidinium_carterae.1